MVLGDRAGVGGIFQRRDEAAVDHAVAERAPSGAPAFGGFLPAEIFDVHGGVERCDELGLSGPREAALDGGVADVEAHAAVSGVEVADETEHIPDGRADVVVAGVILKTGLETEVFAGGGEVAQRGGNFFELVGGGAREVVFPVAEAEAFHAVVREGAEGGFGVFLVEARDVGGGEVEIEAAAAQGGGEAREIVGDAHWLDLAFGADGALDAVPADVGDVGGSLLGVEVLERFGKRDDLTAQSRGGRGRARTEREGGGGDGGLGEEGAAGNVG